MADMDIDVVDAVGMDGFVREGRRLFPHAIRARSVSQMVIAVVNRLGSNRLRRLRIIGHAAAGVNGAVSLLTTMNPNQLIQMDGHGRLQDTTALSLLAGRFAPDGFVELHGCDSGGSMGEMLLTEISALWSVRVHTGNEQDTRPGFENLACAAAPAACGMMSWR